MRSQFEQLGVTIPEELASTASEAFEVWSTNGPSLALYQACSTQWQVIGGAAGFIHRGLDYAGVDVAMRRLGAKKKDRAGLFADLQVMEAAALPILNESLK